MIEVALIAEGLMHPVEHEGTVSLSLSDEEADLLTRILPGYLSDLRMEVAGTDRFELRQSLKHDEELLKSIIGHVRALSHPQRTVTVMR